VVVICILHLTLTGSVNAIDSAYQWTDNQGQIHYSDKPPASNDSRAIRLQRYMSGLNVRPGLRPGEQKQLEKIEQRRQLQQRHAKTARNKTDRQRAARRSGCDDNRAMLKKSRGNKNFKKFSRYLRDNCW
jgi:hypothetical protein